MTAPFEMPPGFTPGLPLGVDPFDATPPAPAAPVEFSDLFDDWIGGASIAKRSVAIYGRPDLVAQYEELVRRLKVAEADAENGTEFGSNPVTRIEAEMVDLHAAWMESRSVWTVAAIDSDRIEELRVGNADLGEVELVEPTRPTAPLSPAPIKAGASPAEQRSFTTATQTHQAALTAHEVALAEWRTANAEFQSELSLRIIAETVDQIEYSGGRIQTAVTVEQLRQVRTKLGKRQLLRLSQAASEASVHDVEIPAPFSRRNSSDGQTS